MSDRRPKFTCDGCDAERRYLPGFTRASAVPPGWQRDDSTGSLLCGRCAHTELLDRERVSKRGDDG